MGSLTIQLIFFHQRWLFQKYYIGKLEKLLSDLQKCHNKDEVV